MTALDVSAYMTSMGRNRCMHCAGVGERAGANGRGQVSRSTGMATQEVTTRHGTAERRRRHRERYPVLTPYAAAN